MTLTGRACHRYLSCLPRLPYLANLPYMSLPVGVPIAHLSRHLTWSIYLELIITITTITTITTIATITMSLPILLAALDPRQVYHFAINER